MSYRDIAEIIARRGPSNWVVSYFALGIRGDERDFDDCLKAAAMHADTAKWWERATLVGENPYEPATPRPEQVWKYQTLKINSDLKSELWLAAAVGLASRDRLAGWGPVWPDWFD